MIGSIVVLYNPSEEEIKNVNSYIDKVDFGVIIDNSTVDNEQWIFSLLNNDGKIKYYSEQKNLGLCRAFNIGVGFLKQKGCDWALLFDADSKLEKDIVSIYKDAIRLYDKDQVAVFCPVHVFERSKNQPYDGYKEVKWSMTSGWLVNINIFDKQNGFFEELFVDGLDMDYCYKSLGNGYKIIECGNAYLIHNPAETKSISIFGRKIKYGTASPFRYYMQARQLVWCLLNYKEKECFVLYCYKWFKVIFLFSNKKEYIRSMLKGTKDGKIIYKKQKSNNI